MFGIALSVAACLRAGTRVDVAWVVGGHDLGEFDAADAVALTPGGGRTGNVLSGALDGQLAELAGRGSSGDRASGGRLLTLEVAPVDALLAGLPHGGTVQCVLAPAEALPADIWPSLVARRPVCLVSQVHDGALTSVAWFDADSIDAAGGEIAALFRRGAATSVCSADVLVTVLWPTPRLVVMGVGEIADALAAAGRLLGWQAVVVADPDVATGTVAGLSPMDHLVVMGHEVEPVGRVLAAALASDVGYIGALGSRRMQEQRADWLAYRGIVELDRIHGPAGLDIGARTPAEIAVAIVAEALAERHRTAGTANAR